MYKIKLSHFGSIEYFENGKSMQIDIDLREQVLEICLLCIQHWNSPFEDIDISQEEKYRIAQNVKNCLEKKTGKKCEII